MAALGLEGRGDPDSFTPLRVTMRRWNRLARLLRNVPAPEPAAPNSLRSHEYWSSYNVTGGRIFQSREESLRYFAWRSEQYFDYLKYMPVAGQDARVVLDYGCGPGHDLVGFLEFSRPARLIGIDVSFPSLAQAARRLTLHHAQASLIQIGEDANRLPLADGSVDYIHSSGVLHHVPDPNLVLGEFRRVIRPDGSARIMVYNYESLWLHLFAAYIVRFTQAAGQGIGVREAFKRSTDTSQCPISHAWTVDEVTAMCDRAGFTTQHLGNAVAAREMAILPERFRAILEPELEPEHRRFLLELIFDQRGVPYYQGKAAGIDACYLLVPRRD